MIEIQTKIHDKFSIEFKVGFSGREGAKVNHFDVNSWIFIPNGLYINKQTYSKDRFYIDMKSNVRLLTPAFSLKQMVEGDNAPFFHLKKALRDALTQPSPEHDSEYEFQLKLFAAIFKSSIRNESTEIVNHLEDDLIYERCSVYAADVQQVVQCFRDLEESIDSTNTEFASKFGFADEFISHQVEIRTMRIIKAIQDMKQSGVNDAFKVLADMLTKETAYKVAKQ